MKALELAGGSNLTRLRKILGPGDHDPEEKVRDVRAIYDELEVRLKAENLAYDYFNRAFQALDQVAVNTERKNELKQLAVNLIGRVK